MLSLVFLLYQDDIQSTSSFIHSYYIIVPVDRGPTYKNQKTQRIGLRWDEQIILTC